MPLTTEQRQAVTEALKRKGYNGPIPQDQVPVQAQPQGNDLRSTLEQLKLAGLLPQKKNLGHRIADFASMAVGGKEIPLESDSGVGSDITKTITTEAIKNTFEDPTVRQLREAEIAALKQPPPKGFVRVGKQTLPDPDYIDVEEQRKIDEEDRVRTATEESILNNAEQNLSSITKAKEGLKFFGPLGDLPTVAAPSSLFGQYGERQEWENNINQLLKQKVVDLIMEMKQASKTGATGFGQLSNQEGKLLQQASTALSKRLPPDRALYYLNEMEKINKKILSGRKNPALSTDAESGISNADEQVNSLLDQLGAD